MWNKQLFLVLFDAINNQNILKFENEKSISRNATQLAVSHFI